MTLKEFISKLNVDDETRFTIMKRNGPKMMNKREAAWNNVIHAHAHHKVCDWDFSDSPELRIWLDI